MRAKRPVMARPPWPLENWEYSPPLFPGNVPTSKFPLIVRPLSDTVIDTTPAGPFNSAGWSALGARPVTSTPARCGICPQRGRRGKVPAGGHFCRYRQGPCPTGSRRAARGLGVVGEAQKVTGWCLSSKAGYGRWKMWLRWSTNTLRAARRSWRIGWSDD